MIVVLVRRIPGGFVPEEDQGYILVNALLPDAASLERTDAVMKKAEAILEENEAIEGFNTITGYSLLTGAYSSNMGFFFVQLKPWEERHDRRGARERAWSPRSTGRSPQQIPEGGVVAFGPPAIPGLGTGAGFTMQLQDRSGGVAGVPGRSRRSASWRRRASGRRSAASAPSTARACRRSTPTSTAARC